MIKTKRNSLEKFIREQMEGPGACNNHFYCIGADNQPIEVQEEVLNTTPGSVYSTAVLFPQHKQKAENSENSSQPSVVDNSDLDSDTDYQESQDDNSSEELDERINRLGSDDEDLYSLSQRFPTTIGISCCLDSGEKELASSDFKVIISGRYYTKIPKSECTNVIIRIDDIAGFSEFFNNYQEKLASFSLVSDGIRLSQDISKNIASVKETILSINKELCGLVAKNDDGSLDAEYQAIGDNYRYLKSYKERLWRRLKYFKEKYLSVEEKKIVEKRIYNIEKYETYLSYLEDAMNICNAKSFGFWHSHTFSKEIDTSGIDFNMPGNKVIFSPRKNKNLNVLFDDKSDSSFILRLSVWLQLTKFANGGDVPGGKKYLKVQLENTSTPFEEDSNHYFSIVTEKVNERCFFGVEIKVESDLLCPYQNHNNETLQDDVEQLNYLYRSIKDYGVGHLCSVDWKISESEKWIKSEFIPSFETPDVEPIPRDKYKYVEIDGKQIPQPLLEDAKALEFKWLSLFSDADNDTVINKLYEFVDTYGQWIVNQRTILDNDDGDNHIGYANLKQCENDYSRMKSNIEMLLDGNNDNIEAFRLMNSAMFIQLWHSKNHADQITTFDFYRNASDFLFGKFSATWRPFQLAFILLNLDGIYQRPDDPKWEKRNDLVDLVWFPTGGGKTEAYLGIIALTIINRRKNEQKCGGTTAIMRYTLRLLATQQFQRAMRVILALEQLRKWDIYNLGEEPISIGLFVGDDSLPNHAGGRDGLLDECHKWSDCGTDGKRKGSKIPLDKCPFCGSQLEYVNKGAQTTPKIEFRCSNIDCTFSNSLPVLLCDEYIYQQPPTLLFGTVDKFAMLGHNVSTRNSIQDSRRLFGKGELDNLPPSLIIQDELHLLLGPLGSAVSLFECAIDQLCSYKNKNGVIVRPKIISSTATTRNTERQIRALYDRNVSIFPKSGTDYDDSFFSFYQREKKDGEVNFVSKRKYIGILPTGRTHMTTQMRLVVTMFVHRALFEQEYAQRLKDKDVENAIDYYHSIIDYFNSLKEVGKTDAQFYTEYTKYTRRLFKRVLRYNDKLECLYGYDSSFSKSELTGRLTGAEVVNELESVSKHWDSKKRYPHQVNGEWVKGETPPDLILATNMISVGLDVDRFNTIVMNSMPRNIAEYIQASSRVARNKPGLVVTLHNPFRARDLSHFERFKEFHEKLYYYVEPISITPFSKKSVAKYMPLYIAAMIRHNYPELANMENASSLTDDKRDEIVKELSKYFKNRLASTKTLSVELRELLTDELEQYIEEFLQEAMENWQLLVDGQSAGGYSLRYSGSDLINGNNRVRVRYKDLFLALDAYQDDDARNMWAVPMSLRTVESEAVLNVKDN